jgi:multidrug resistance efflux pump
MAAACRAGCGSWVAVALVLVAAGGGAWWWFAGRPVEVRTAAALAPGSGDAAAGGAILQATGYVTARRQATVSTQITGTLTQVLIEEGDASRRARSSPASKTAACAPPRVARGQRQSAQAQVAQAQAQLAQAHGRSRRSDELAASGMLSKQAAEQGAHRRGDVRGPARRAPPRGPIAHAPTRGRRR